MATDLKVDWQAAEDNKASHSGNGLPGIEAPKMILLIMRIKHMRGTDATDFRHYGRILARCIPKKCPVCASSAIDDVINRSCAQTKTRLYVPMFHSCFTAN